MVKMALVEILSQLDFIYWEIKVILSPFDKTPTKMRFLILSHKSHSKTPPQYHCPMHVHLFSIVHPTVSDFPRLTSHATKDDVVPPVVDSSKSDSTLIISNPHSSHLLQRLSLSLSLLFQHSCVPPPQLSASTASYWQVFSFSIVPEFFFSFSLQFSLIVVLLWLWLL